MPESVDVFEEAEGFQWSVFLLLPAADIYVGKTFRFAGNECNGPDCAVGFADSIGGEPGVANTWLASGLHCGDETYDLPVSGEIVTVGDDTITIEIRDLCFTDYGPMQADDLPDDSSDDVIHRVEGRYEISLCSEPVSRSS
jgi:hypothetical protein